MTEELTYKLTNIIKACEKLLAHFQVEGTLEYIGVYSKSQEQYDRLLKENLELGKVVETHPSGIIVKHRKRLKIEGREIAFLHILRPDTKRRELGDGDFKVSDWNELAKRIGNTPNTRILDRGKYKMIELTLQDVPARVYFSSVPLSCEY